MDSLRRTLYVLFSAFLVYYSSELVVDLRSAAPSLRRWETIVWGSWLTVCLTGSFAFLGFALPTSRLLPASFYRIDREEALRTLYRYMGVRWFRRLLMIAFWGLPRNRAKYFDGTRRGLDRFDHHTRQSEFGHLAAFVVVLIAGAYFAVTGSIALSIVVCIANVAGNLYPVVLQRYHRLRIQRIRA